MIILDVTVSIDRIAYSKKIVGSSQELTENWLAITGEDSQMLGTICHCLNSPLKPLDMLPLLYFKERMPIFER